MATQKTAGATSDGDEGSDQRLTTDERLFLEAIRAGLAGDTGRMQQTLRRSLTRGRRLWGEDQQQLRNAMLIAAASAAPPVPSDLTSRSRDLLSGWRPPDRIEGLRFPEPGRSTSEPSHRGSQTNDRPDLAELPVGLDRDENPPYEPVLSADTEEVLLGVVAEHSSELLAERGLAPTRTVLLTGAPGTGKTMTARWIAGLLGRSLLVLNLAAIMSHELGQSANNLTAALDAAEQSSSVLFIDEFDAVASHRGNSNDVGEMRRLVNVLLMRLDRWSNGNLLLAATNHPELLDKAINRRFEVHVELSPPALTSREHILRNLLPSLPTTHIHTFAMITDGYSGSDLTTTALRAARKAALDSRSPELPDLLRELTRDGKLPKDVRDHLIYEFNSHGMSLRKIGELVGLSHVSVRQVLNPDSRDRKKC